MKTAVYSWRLAVEEKGALEHEARREGLSTAELLSRIVQLWLAQRRRMAAQEDAEQARLRAAAMRAIGTIAGGNPSRAETARQALRQRLRKGHDR